MVNSFEDLPAPRELAPCSRLAERATVPFDLNGWKRCDPLQNR